MTWEYLVQRMTVGQSLVVSGGVKQPAPVPKDVPTKKYASLEEYVRALNELGTGGWELVDIDKCALHYFKRPKGTETNG